MTMRNILDPFMYLYSPKKSKRIMEEKGLFVVCYLPYVIYNSYDVSIYIIYICPKKYRVNEKNWEFNVNSQFYIQF